MNTDASHRVYSRGDATPGDDAARLLAALSDRRTCRVYQERPIEKAVIEAILLEATSAPCASNTQNWHFIVVTDPGMKARLQEIAGGNPHFRTCSALIYLCFQKGWSHDKFAIVQSVAAACYQMICSAHLRGLATAWNAGIGDTAKVAEILGVPGTFEIQGALSVGYAAQEAPLIKAPRRPLAEVTSWNGFSRPGHTLYPARPSERYPFHEIGRERNPFAEWDPAIWGWDRIADFRGYTVWAKSPVAGIYQSRRLADSMKSEIGAFPPLQPGANILDLMPWGGTSTVALARHFGEGVNLHVAELSASNCHFIEERFFQEGLPRSRLTRQVIRAGRLPCPDESMDAVFASLSLEHTPDPMATVDEIRRVLKPGASAVLSIRNATSRFGVHHFRNGVMTQVPNQGPFKPIAAQGMSKQLRARFRLVREFGLTPDLHHGSRIYNDFRKYRSQHYVACVRR